MSTHLEKPPRIFFPSGLLNEMVTIPTAANNAIPYISRIRNVYFGSFSGRVIIAITRKLLKNSTVTTVFQTDAGSLPSSNTM